MTGRSIVCGPDLYLYYHGIDTHQRHEDIAAMLEAPAQNETLFKQYGVEYVYIGSSERGNFACDTDWFHQNGALVYQQNGISIYRLNIQ